MHWLLTLPVRHVRLCLLVFSFALLPVAATAANPDDRYATVCEVEYIQADNFADFVSGTSQTPSITLLETATLERTYESKDLEQTVQELIAQGWRPAGGLFGETTDVSKYVPSADKHEMIMVGIKCQALWR